MHVYAQLLSYSHEITSKKTITTLLFILDKLSKSFIEEFYYNALGAFFSRIDTTH